MWFFDIRFLGTISIEMMSISLECGYFGVLFWCLILVLLAKYCYACYAKAKFSKQFSIRHSVVQCAVYCPRLFKSIPVDLISCFIQSSHDEMILLIDSVCRYSAFVRLGLLVKRTISTHLYFRGLKWCSMSILLREFPTIFLFRLPFWFASCVEVVWWMVLRQFIIRQISFWMMIAETKWERDPNISFQSVQIYCSKF